MATAGETVGLRGNSPAYEYTTHKKPVIHSNGSTRTLTELESGSVVLFDRAAGTVFTLPDATNPGINYEFVCTNIDGTIAALSKFKVITNLITASPVIIGALDVFAQPLTGVTTWNAFPADAAVAIGMNGKTTGGDVGSRFTITSISKGTWFVSGLLVGTGTLVTPFKTS